MYFIKEWWCAYMKSRVRLIPIASIILISSTFSLSGCKLKRELEVPFAETTVTIVYAAEISVTSVPSAVVINFSAVTK